MKLIFEKINKLNNSIQIYQEKETTFKLTILKIKDGSSLNTLSIFKGLWGKFKVNFILKKFNLDKMDT